MLSPPTFQTALELLGPPVGIAEPGDRAEQLQRPAKVTAAFGAVGLVKDAHLAVLLVECRLDLCGNGLSPDVRHHPLVQWPRGSNVEIGVCGWKVMPRDGVAGGLKDLLRAGNLADVLAVRADG